MDVFTIAAELLGDLKLTSGQLGQLRALEYRLLLESVRRPGRFPGSAGSTADAMDEPAARLERDVVLRAQIVAEILEMLTPEQRAELNRR